eukprot:GEMP01022595.1.p1 GENE.GEMP01022595.1~~GEMP01022595.1.p1  ORF type:complete len:629 (+),score=135.42 GEMP01022595.1:234-2120(+)
MRIFVLCCAPLVASGFGSPAVTILGPVKTEMFARCLDTPFCEVSSRPSDKYIARAKFQPNMKKFGFDNFKARTAQLSAPNKDCEQDAPKAYMAGFLEGMMTVAGIQAFAYNTANSGAWKTISQRDEAAVRQWWSEMEAFMESKASCLNTITWPHNPLDDCAYWYHIVLAYYQLKGMTDGYNSQIPAGGAKMTTFDFFRINSDGNIENIIEGVAALSTKDFSPNLHEPEKMGRCSALVKLVNNDIFMSHATWEGYSEMARSWKFYDFDFCYSQAKQISFSGYPGVISSTDDMYVTSTMLGVQETTLPNFKGWAALKKHLVPDSFHIIASLRRAENGKHFTELFMDSANTKTSGMYISQWMVVDYNLLDKKDRSTKKLHPGTFMVVEVAPGVSVIRDETDRLQKDTFWGSVNHAVYGETAGALGVKSPVEETTRWRIFNEYQKHVKTMDDMKSIMRFASKTGTIAGAVENFRLAETISARYDLDNGMLEGGVDAKIVDRNSVAAMEVLAQAGPSYDNLPPFDFSYYPNAPHKGVPFGPLRWPWFTVNEEGMRPLAEKVESDWIVNKKLGMLLVFGAPMLGLMTFLVIWSVLWQHPVRHQKDDVEALMLHLTRDSRSIGNYGTSRTPTCGP